jgi:biopolymer transport protein ExbD
MAYKPSQRRSSESLEMDLDIRPVMNLMVVLIPLLLQGAEWVKLGAIEINAPPTKSGGSGDQQEQQDKKEEEKKIGLKLAVTQEGITIANASVILTSEEGDGPTVPIKNDGTYDFDLLREKLIEVKKAIAGKGYKDENRAVITAAKEIEYKNIVEVIDNIQTYEDDQGNQKALFPEVNFGSVIQ